MSISRTDNTISGFRRVDNDLRARSDPVDRGTHRIQTKSPRLTVARIHSASSGSIHDPVLSGGMTQQKIQSAVYNQIRVISILREKSVLAMGDHAAHKN
jgi:hypothetical protein